ncbi:unnamed protein product [Porites evermanni]|uniref:Solute carrier family 35 member F5 n=1 Tax=Porites evermanni TaxID=104178 RepID=A0ABN8SBT2_9CNID|nr:unnamed protein product [Porites evermanni]
MSSTSSSRLCSCFRSTWASTGQFIVSQEDRVRRRRRLLLGVVVLLLVDVLWVGSSELTDFIFKYEGFDKPFFTTFFKTSSFMIYLTGFLFYEPWRLQCIACLKNETSSNVLVSAVNQDSEHTSLLNSPSSSGETTPIPRPLMNEPTFEEMTDDDISTSRSADVASISFEIIPTNLHFSEHNSEQARLTRLPYHLGEDQKLPVHRVAKVALLFCLLWFCANCSYQEAIAHTSPAAVNILSSSSGLFTLILASVFQSSSADKFSITKLLAVLMSITGIVLVTLSDSKNKAGGISVGALWALASAFLYSCYLIMLKHKVPDEKQMDIPMFFGLVGAFNFFLLWPGFLFLNYLRLEVFELPPSATVWGYIALNAFIGTVLSEFLWLWGCYLTSSSTATLSLSLIIPLTMCVDVFMRRVHFSWMFLLGTIPAFASFFAVSLLTHYGDWDPILIGLKKLLNIRRRRMTSGTLDVEQREGLINSVRDEENDLCSNKNEHLS